MDGGEPKRRWSSSPSAELTAVPSTIGSRWRPLGPGTLQEPRDLRPVTPRISATRDASRRARSTGGSPDPLVDVGHDSARDLACTLSDTDVPVSLPGGAPSTRRVGRGQPAAGSTAPVSPRQGSARRGRRSRAGEIDGPSYGVRPPACHLPRSDAPAWATGSASTEPDPSALFNALAVGRSPGGTPPRPRGRAPPHPGGSARPRPAGRRLRGRVSVIESNPAICRSTAAPMPAGCSITRIVAASAAAARIRSASGRQETGVSGRGVIATAVRSAAMAAVSSPANVEPGDPQHRELVPGRIASAASYPARATSAFNGPSHAPAGPRRTTDRRWWTPRLVRLCRELGARPASPRNQARRASQASSAAPGGAAGSSRRSFRLVQPAELGCASPATAARRHCQARS